MVDDIRNTIDKLIDLNSIKIIPQGEVKFTGKIGQGGQSKVYMGEYQGHKVAIKVISSLDYKCFAHELVILSHLEHPNIPKFYGIITEKGSPFLVFEFIHGKTLDEFKPETFTLEQKKRMTYDIASIFEYIHSNNFIHRDLKPENLMVDKNGRIFLIDFGIAKVCTTDDYTITRAKGTLNYLAPESLEPCEINDEGQIISKIDSKVDVWSFGCTVSWLFSGIVPWADKFKDTPSVIQQVLFKKIDFSIPKNIVDPVIINVIKMATYVDTNKRATMKEIKKYLDDNLTLNDK